MSDTLVISLVVAACGMLNAGVVFATFWLQRGKSEGGLEATLKALQIEAAQASVLAAKALAHSEALSGEVADWRVETAAKIERLRTIAEMQVGNAASAELRLVKSLDDVGSRIDKLTARFDSWLEAQARGAGGA